MVDRIIIVNYIDHMVKINEKKVNNLKMHVRLACYMLANVTDEKTLMPSINGRPMNSAELTMFINISKVAFGKTYFDMLRENVVAMIATGSLECIVLNPDFFTGWHDSEYINFLRNTVFSVENITLRKNNTSMPREDMSSLRKRMKEFRKLGIMVS